MSAAGPFARGPAGAHRTWPGRPKPPPLPSSPQAARKHPSTALPMQTTRPQNPNPAGSLDDAFALSLSRQLGPSVFLRLTQSLGARRVPEYAPWRVALTKLQRMRVRA